MNGYKKSKVIKMKLTSENDVTRIRMVMVAAECSGFAKVGGLGDVVNDLSRNLQNKVDSIAIFLPGYADNVKAKVVYRCTVNFSKRLYIVKLKYFNHDGMAFYFICCKTFFGGKYSSVYINSNSNRKGPFEDDACRFAFYSKAILEILLHCDLFKDVNLLHCHDWHTGFLFLLLKIDPAFKTLRYKLKTVFTIHNLNYQGIRPFTLPFDIFGQSSFRSWAPLLFKKLCRSSLLHSICYPAERQPLPEAEVKLLLLKTAYNKNVHNKIKRLYKLDSTTGRYCIQNMASEAERKYLYRELMNRGCLCFNPMRTAINFSDQVSTVSETYAAEITFHDTETQIYGCGLENDLRKKIINNRLIGIINGIDYDVHNPKKLRFPFDTDRDNWQADKEAGKYEFLRELPQTVKEIYLRHRKKFFNYDNVISHLPHIKVATYQDKPLFVFIGRAVAQKLGILFPEKNSLLIEKILAHDAFFIFTGMGNFDTQVEILNRHENALYFNVFDEEFGKLLYGYADFFLMPSYYEPCGISQLIAMRYGTLPIVHDVGGLHDTVSNGESGFKFSATQEMSVYESLLETIGSAVDCFNDKYNMQYMRNFAARVRFDWGKSTEQYLAMYKSLFEI